MHTLQWAREHGCDWDWRTCEAALNGRRLEILEWAIVSGCSMESNGGAFNLCEDAADKGYWDIMPLAWSHGCSCSDEVKLGYKLHSQLQEKRRECKRRERVSR